MHIYRWDLDKTYLDTDFESLRGLVRSAVEKPAQKRSLPGARALMRALGERPGARVCILSGSPVQLRSKLEEKLRLDGVLVHSFTLKDTVGNIKAGRLRAVRGQFGYKLPVLLAERKGIGATVHETLFGDDAEVDALVYSVYADAIAGRLTPHELSRILEAAGAYPDGVGMALEALAQVALAPDAVDRIFIRIEKGRPIERFAPLAPRVVPVRSWWQAALVLVADGVLRADQARAVLDHVIEAGEAPAPFGPAGLVQDLVLRGVLQPEAVQAIDAPAEVADQCARAVLRLGGAAPAPHGPMVVPDYLSLVRAR